MTIGTMNMNSVTGYAIPEFKRPVRHNGADFGICVVCSENNAHFKKATDSTDFTDCRLSGMESSVKSV